MCHICITEGVRAGVTRRAMMAGAAAASGMALTPGNAIVQSKGPVSFNRAIDLAHRLTPDFPTYFGTPAFTAEDMSLYPTSNCPRPSVSKAFAVLFDTSSCRPDMLRNRTNWL